MADNGKPLRPSRDNFSLMIPCPKCGKQASQTLAWLVANDVLACSGCGFSIDLKSEKVRALVEEAEKKFSAIWGQKPE
jgi:transcription elongation factor Elf1